MLPANRIANLDHRPAEEIKGEMMFLILFSRFMREVDEIVGAARERHPDDSHQAAFVNGALFGIAAYWRKIHPNDPTATEDCFRHLANIFGNLVDRYQQDCDAYAEALMTEAIDAGLFPAGT